MTAQEIAAPAQMLEIHRELRKRSSITHVGLVILGCLAFWAIAAVALAMKL